MTNDVFNRPDSGTAKTALSSGIASLILLILFFTPWFGVFVLYGSIVMGILGIVFGALALKRRQPKGAAVTGLVLGAICVLIGAGIQIFALMFIGAIFA